MKVLWVCNIVIPRISKAISEKPRNVGGWLTGISNALLSSDKVELAICFPYNKTIHGKTEKLEYFGLSSGSSDEFESIIKEFEPDILHIWGTESKHSKNALVAAQKLNVLARSVVSIQGLVSIYAKHYYASLPHKVIRRWSISDVLVKGNIAVQKRKLEKRGLDEETAIKTAVNIIGRTDWDRACVERINPDAKYYFCNETLRDSFYSNAGKWSYENCERHSIFVSQSHYPIKGFHLMLEALKDVVRVYPDTVLYTTGDSPFKKGISSFIRRSYYKKYIGKLINKYALTNNVVFLENLDEKQMCERFLKSNVFVCCSSIENSPNSLGEALLLGVPVVSSDVGGVKNMVKHETEGFVYPYDEPYMCAYYIKKIFADDELASRISKAGNIHGKALFDIEKNLNRLVEIYTEIKKEHC